MGSLQICSVGVTLSVLKFLVVCYPIFCPLNLPTNLENIMGGCAGKPRDSDLDKAPAPVEAPTASENTGVETVHQVTTLFDRELIYYNYRNLFSRIIVFILMILGKLELTSMLI